MSRAIDAEFAKLRAVAARIPEGSPGYDRAREALRALHVRVGLARTLSHHEALLAVRTAREQIEKIVAGRE